MSEFLPMITERNGVPVTTSRAIAEQFGKEHFNVLRDIENLINSLNATEEGENFGKFNFELAEYTDAQGKSRPAYILTRDGFTLLAMGFTGAKALEFKIAYINAFNRMEQYIKGGGESIPARALERVERRIAALEATGRPLPAVDEPGRKNGRREDAQEFLRAIHEAVDRGEYTICYSWQAGDEARENLLGKVHRDAIALKAWLAYEIYERQAEDPLALSALVSVLVRNGVALKTKRRIYPYNTQFKDRTPTRAIYIDKGAWCK